MSSFEEDEVKLYHRLIARLGRCKNMIGFVYALLSAISGATSLLLVKYMDATAEEMQLMRSVLQYFITLPVMHYSKRPVFGRNIAENFFLFSSCIAAIVANWASNYSVLYVPLGDSVSILHTNVVLVGIFSCICLRERCTWMEGLFSILTLVGLVLVARPSYLFGSGIENQVLHIKGIFLALASAILTALMYILLRKLGPSVHISVSQFHYSWIGIILSLVFATANEPIRIPCIRNLIFLASSAAAALMAHVFITLALQKEKAGPLAIVHSTQIIFSIVLEFIFLQYSAPITSLIGSILIFGCSVCLTARKIRESGQ